MATMPFVSLEINCYGCVNSCAPGDFVSLKTMYILPKVTIHVYIYIYIFAASSAQTRSCNIGNYAIYFGCPLFRNSAHYSCQICCVCNWYM